MERKRTDCPALPPGWKKEEVIRKSGLSAGKSDVYYYSPTGKKFRSKPQLARYLGNAVDLACFDFRTGKVMPGKLQKSKQRVRHDAQSLAKGAKPDLSTSLPIRQTASIFKQPVTKVTGHPGNRVKADPQRPAEPPRQVSLGVGGRHGDRPLTPDALQLFWEKRLTGLRPADVAEEVLRGLEPPKGLLGIGPGGGDVLLAAIAGALHLGQKNPGQALCRGLTVTDQQIRAQELKVSQARRSLEEALTADGLARAAENSRELLLPGSTA